MQLKIQIDLEEPCSLPLAYHHLVQSALYSLMEEPEVGRSIYHDRGACYGKRIYRLFTFGPLKGTYRLEKKQIIFGERISLEVRSVDEHCLRLIETGLKKNGIRLGEKRFLQVGTKLCNDTIETESLFISMESPICVYATDRQTKHTVFFSPLETRFFEAVNENFMRKYQAAFSEIPEAGIELKAVQVESRDKYVTRYKDYYISGWKGKYQLSGKRKYLDFLYQTGLGAKNSQGFGMFRMEHHKCHIEEI